MTAAYQAIGVLVLGAVVLLILVGRVSARPRIGALIGLPFAIVGAILGLQAQQPLSLAVVALCAVGGVALLLVPVLEPEVPGHDAKPPPCCCSGQGGPSRWPAQPTCCRRSSAWRRWR